MSPSLRCEPECRSSGGKQTWHKSYLVLYRGILYMLDQAVEPTKPASDSTNPAADIEDRYGERLESACHERVQMSPSDGEVLVSSAVPASELMGTARSDIPFTFKVELKPHTTCWPPKLVCSATCVAVFRVQPEESSR
ncbi:hypothetical protein HPB51_018555 [Rhipicephalus microplus]|uniref:PH domain-containing protein n=1 Tax=Rhipicephalus microplus TaxID=6941 RepID=A0A9J6F530_RHIMP|nr:hypothetical protein HPB51_018555 [Rhipicephalus microplus]